MTPAVAGGLAGGQAPGEPADGTGQYSPRSGGARAVASVGAAPHQVSSDGHQEGLRPEQWGEGTGRGVPDAGQHSLPGAVAAATYAGHFGKTRSNASIWSMFSGLERCSVKPASAARS